MGAQHKPPLYAFVVVMLVGALVMTYAARSEALRQEMLQRTVVVAGSVFDRAPAAPAPPVAGIVMAAPAVAPPAAVPPVAKAADRQRPSTSGQQVAAEREHRAPKPGQHHAQPDAQAQPAAPHVKDPSPGPGKDDAPGLIQALDHILAQAPGLLTAPGLMGGKDDGADKGKDGKGEDKAKGDKNSGDKNEGKKAPGDKNKGKKAPGDKNKGKNKHKGHGKKG